jgi:hypothetical protein
MKKRRKTTNKKRGERGSTSPNKRFGEIGVEVIM